MRVKDSVEILYLTLMYRWETTAPEDRKQGLLDSEPERNTQMARMVYLLNTVATGNEDRTFRKLSVYTPREDGESYISRNPSWMKQPKELFGGWYFEGCSSLQQKHFILQNLTKVGLSPVFVACADDFVAGKSIKRYFPTKAEEANDKVGNGLKSGDWSVRAPATPKVSVKDIADNYKNLSDEEKAAAAPLLRALGIPIPA